MIPRPTAWMICACFAALPVGGQESEPPPPIPPDTEDSAEAPSQSDPLQIYEEVEVRGRADDLVGLAASAGEGSTGRVDLARRPILRPGELMETTPGVIATQHSGGGKANQFFVRGFNLDHGTDFAIRVAGVPVNMPSHGHGQGYADLNFLIPELVERVRYRKGPYHAAVGDFSSAGSADFELVRSLDKGHLSASGGSHGYGRLLWADSFERPTGGVITTGVELFEDDGPWTRAEDYNGYKALVRYSAGDPRRGHSVTFMGYDADWLSTDQVPRRAVESGLIGRFDLIDPGPRGHTRRFSLSAEVHRGTGETFTELSAYAMSYDFGLISNFTYFLDDPENGDQFEQEDERFVTGLALRRSWLASWGARSVELSAGADLRFDDIDNGLHRTRELQRLRTVRQDRIEQLQGGAFIDALVRWSPKVKTRLGLRGDLYDARVKSGLEENSGSADDALLSPKLSLIFGPWKSTELYVNMGYGFHSNDARGAVINVDPLTGEAATPVQPLVRAKGADVGLRTSLWPGLQTTLTVFALELDSELVFVGDGGATEASRPSRRLGVEWTNFYRVSDHLTLDLDVTLTDAEFTDRAPEGSEIPGAIGTTIAAGVSFERFAASSSGAFHGSLRWRYFGDIPLIEDDSARWSSSALLNGRLGYRFANGLNLVLDVFNLLDSDDSDVEYFYASRLPGEAADGVEDVHFHPVPSRSARLSLHWRR